jgi:hypothetical protein
VQENTFAWFYRRVDIFDWLHNRVKVIGYNEDELLLACNEIEEPLLQRLKKLPLPVVAVDVDVKRVYLELIVHKLH